MSSRFRADEPGVAWHTCDLLEPGSVDGLVRAVRPSHLLHLAWITEPAVYLSSAENLRWTQSSLRLLDRFVEYAGRRAVIGGTCLEYEPTHDACIEGSTPLAPATTYGASKLALRQAARLCADQHGLSLAMTHIFNIYGPYERQSRFVPSVVTALLAGEPARCTSGLQQRDYLHVEDVAAAHVRLLELDVCGDVNVASGQPVSIADLARAIAATCGKPDLLELGALSARADETPVVYGDTRRLRLELEWSPRFELAEGLTKTVAWWRGALCTA